MAHLINITAGRASFGYAGEAPWHGLGTKVPGLMKTREAIIAGGLDYFVDLEPLMTPPSMGVDEKGNVTTLPGIQCSFAKATVRRDTREIFGIVGPDYEVVQNTEAFEFFDEALGKGVAAIETVGALGKGERIFAMAKMPEMIEVTPNDVVERYLLLTAAHDGTGAIKCLFTPIRVVCNNTLTAALRGARNVVSIKHTKNAKENLKKVHTLLVRNEKFWQKTQDALTFLASKEMDKDAVKNFLKDLFPAKKKDEEKAVVVAPGTQDVKDAITPTDPLAEDASQDDEEPSKRVQNIMDRIEMLFGGQATGSNLAGTTRWGMLNAVTHYIDHERVLRKRKDGFDPHEDKGARWEASVFGLGSGLRQRAMDLLLKV
jgi:phage/plasmid-like protein (TIGR03299 family)